MKNKLAENMLRFGTKNLTESNIIKLTEARAPEDTFANDSDKVKQHPIYEAFKKRWMKGGDFISGFDAWAGAGGTGNAASTRSVAASKSGPVNLKNLQTELTKLGKTEVAAAVGKILNWVTGLIEQNIILDGSLLSSLTEGFVRSIMLRYYFSSKSSIPTADKYDNWATYYGVNQIKNIDSDINKVKVAESAKPFIAMSDADKIEALNFWQSEAQKIVDSDKQRKGIRNKDFSKINTLDQAIMLSTTLKVKSKGGSIEKGKDTITKSVPYTTQLTWPDISNPASLTDMQTMFLDNGYKLKDEVKSKIEAFIKAGIEAMQKAGKTVKVIKYGGMSMTSTVPTTFGGVDDKGTAIKKNSSKENNEFLAEARANSIASYLKSMLEGLGLPQVKLIAVNNRIQANHGPEWEERDRNLDLGSPGNRTKLYNDTYGPYRKNSGFVEITGEAEVTEEELTPSYTGKTGYTYEIKWIGRHRPPKPLKTRGSAGGGKSYVGVKVLTTSCPAFQ